MKKIEETGIVSLELGIQLKSGGFLQNTRYSWVCYRGRKNMNESDRWYILETQNSYRFKGDDICAAPTDAEMGEALPEGTLFWKAKNWHVQEGGYKGMLSKDGKINQYKHIKAEIEVNARAKMWLYLNI